MVLLIKACFMASGAALLWALLKVKFAGFIALPVLHIAGISNQGAIYLGIAVLCYFLGNLIARFA